MTQDDSFDKTKITFLERKELDRDEYLEDMLTEEEKNKIHYHTILWSLIFLLLSLLGW